ncbi:hypothetical protein EFR96_00600 [Levilactobacillus brevis]|nr:hypothetical protein [Levilactobacillus brevis]
MAEGKEWTMNRQGTQTKWILILTSLGFFYASIYGGLFLPQFFQIVGQAGRCADDRIWHYYRGPEP